MVESRMGGVYPRTGEIVIGDGLSNLDTRQGRERTTADPARLTSPYPFASPSHMAIPLLAQ
jgi:hypothetical protein